MIEIIDLSEEYTPQYFVCLEDWNQDLAEVRSIKEKWYRDMREKGLRVKLARADDGQIDGMIETMPIEYSCANLFDRHVPTVNEIRVKIEKKLSLLK